VLLPVWTDGQLHGHFPGHCHWSVPTDRLRNMTVADVLPSCLEDDN